MKKKLITLIFLVLGTSGIAQNQWENLDINNIEARINFKDVLFSDLDISAPHFVVDDSGRSTIYAAGIWIAGKDVNGQVKSAVQQYNGCDFKGGCSAVGVYKINKATIDSFRYVFECANDPNCIDYTHVDLVSYNIPNEIVWWPAHGDVSCNEDFYMAPFIDYNNDGIYNPSDGDYPNIKGDQAIWWYMRDDTVHCNGGDPLGIELRCMAYAYNCQNSDAVNNSVFVDYEITNIGTQTLFDSYIGNWSDFDIGCSNDDYLGSSVENGMFYSFNGDNDDLGCNGTLGFGNNNLPMTGTMVFGPFQDPDGQDNPGPTALNPNYLTFNFANSQNGISYPGLGLKYDNGIVDDETMMLRNFSAHSITFDPNTPLERYNTLRGLNPDGYDKYYLLNGDTIKYLYDYPGDSDPKGWGTFGLDSTSNITEISVSNPGGDRRGVGAVGPFTITPGSVYTSTFVYTNAFDPSQTGNLAAKSKLMSYAQDIRAFMDNCQCCNTAVSLNEIFPLDFELSVYPNPSNGVFNIDSDTRIKLIQVYDLRGKLIYENQLNSLRSTLNLSHLSSGLYVMSFQTENAYQTLKIKIE
jgi:hypothetical protein